MRYCSGSGFELLSDSDVMAVCQDSKVRFNKLFGQRTFDIAFIMYNPGRASSIFSGNGMPTILGRS